MASTVQLVGLFVIDFIAFALALVAEQTRSTAKVVVDSEFNYNFCVYDSNIATKLGIAAAALLLFNQILTFFWFKKDGNNGGYNTCCRFLLSTICWGTFMIAEAMLVVGSWRNSERTKYRTIFADEPPNCKALRKGVFEVGAAFVMITSLLSNFISFFYFNSQDYPNKHRNGSTGLGTYTLLP